MAGIAGIAKNGAQKELEMMLGTINYRGRSGKQIVEKDGITAGIIWNEHEDAGIREFLEKGEIGYRYGPGHYVRGIITNGQIRIYRDELGVAPLYYGKDRSGNMCFASEVKSLLKVTDNILEVAPAHYLDASGLTKFFALETGKYFNRDPKEMASELREHLEKAISQCIRSEEAGSWLSGGLDSSSICALAARQVRKLKTFTAGMKDAPDMKYAREMAQFLRS